MSVRFAQPAPAVAPQRPTSDRLVAGLNINLNQVRHAIKNGQFVRVTSQPEKNVGYRKITGAEGAWKTQRKGQTDADFENEREYVFVSYPINVGLGDGTAETLDLRMVGTPADIRAALTAGFSQGKGQPRLAVGPDIINALLATQVGVDNYNVEGTQAQANYQKWYAEGKDASLHGESLFTAEQIMAMWHLFKGGKVLGAEAKAGAAGTGRGRGAKTLVEKYNAKAQEAADKGEVMDVSNYKLGGLKVVKWKKALKKESDPRHVIVDPRIPIVSSDKDSLLQAFTELLGPDSPDLPGIRELINRQYSAAPRAFVSVIQPGGVVAAPVLQAVQPIQTVPVLATAQPIQAAPVAPVPGTTLRQVPLVPAGGLASPGVGTSVRPIPTYNAPAGNF